MSRQDESSYLIPDNYDSKFNSDPGHGQTLDNLRSSVINALKDNCKKTDNYPEISRRLIDRDLSLFDEENSWTNFRLKIKIQLLVESVSSEDIKDANDNEESETTIMLELTTLHILVVMNDEDAIQIAMEKIKGFKHWLSKVKLKAPNSVKIAQENSWIKDANCFHLAAKFNPNGLHCMLSRLKTEDEGKDIFDELYETGKFSPLHVAALINDSLSLR